MTVQTVEQLSDPERFESLMDLGPQRETNGVVATMRSPVFIGVVFLTTVVQVCSDPVLAFANGRGEWTLSLSPQVVISLVALICLAQAVCVSQLATRPELATVGAMACYLLVAVALGVPTWAPPMQLVVAIAMFALGSARAIPVAAVWAVGAVFAALALLGGWTASLGAPPDAIAGFLITTGTSLASLSFAGVTLGILWSVLHRRAERARQHALDLRMQQAEAVEASRTAERGRIAQELHDVAGQHLAGLVSLCDASADLAPAHPQQALQLIDEVRAEGRYAAASLYGALGDLRAVEATAHTPTPDLRRLDELVAFWRERGMEVAVQTHGDQDAPPAVVSTTAYRAIQEALSNAAKHAPGAPVEVGVDIDRGRLRASVVNGPPRRPRADEGGLGLGWGLDNLRQRLALVDGSLHAAADDAGGWRVEADIPLPRTTENARD